MSIWFSEEITYGGAVSLNFRIDEMLCDEESELQNIKVFKNAAFGKVMVIDDVVMLTTRDEFVYHEMITNPAFAVNPGITDVLVIGAGDGGTIRELVKQKSVRRIDWVEIDGRVVELSEKYLPELSSGNHDPRVNKMITDGVRYVTDYKGSPYQLIIVDSTDPVGPGEGLFTTDFYRGCSDILSDDGIVVNQAENPYYSEDWVRGIYGKLERIFPVAALYQAFIPTYPSGHWLFGFGSKKYGPLDIKAMPDFIDGLKYYNEGVHRGAFALPSFIKKIYE